MLLTVMLLAPPPPPPIPFLLTLFLSALLQMLLLEEPRPTRDHLVEGLAIHGWMRSTVMVTSTSSGSVSILTLEWRTVPILRMLGWSACVSGHTRTHTHIHTQTPFPHSPPPSLSSSLPSSPPLSLPLLLPPFFSLQLPPCRYGWQGLTPIAMQVGWKSTTMESPGALSVMMGGISRMQMWCAACWASNPPVQCTKELQYMDQVSLCTLYLLIH